MPTLEQLDTPYERRRVIEYGVDGNKVVRHWHDVQHIAGPLYKSKEEKNKYGEQEMDLYLFFEGGKDGLLYQYSMRHLEQYTPEKMMEEIKHNFDVLARQYPSGMAVNSLLAARNFSLRQNQIVVGNGAAELIKALMERVKGNLGVIRPAFEEYANRCDKEKVIAFVPQTEDFSYDENDVMDFFEGKDLDCLVLVNPDNPTGNYISRKGMLKLARWTKEKNIRFLADESFVDFSEEAEPTLLVEELLDENPHMIVVKSISKSYGIPGLRLGVAASGDTDLIGQLKKDVAIWNINSFGEFYMQIEEKYRKDYDSALDKLRGERTRFAEKLSKLPGVRVFPSQANYLMVELTGKSISATEITELLLTRYNLFIKDLSSKISRNGRQFLRIAIRNEAEDNILVKALKEILAQCSKQ